MSSPETPFTKLTAKAATQFGLFTRPEARACGMHDKAIRALARRGVIERLTPRVFRFAGASPSWHQDVLTACLDGGPECHASHRTAAALHGFDGFPIGGIVEVVVPMEVWLRRRGWVVHHTRDLPECDRTRIGTIPLTTAARTLNDLGAVVPADVVEEAYDGAERDRLVRRSVVDARYSALRAPGRNGIGAMTQIRAGRLDVKRVPWSVLERAMRRLLERAGLPMPSSRVWVECPDGSKHEIDFVYLERKVGLEVEGHGSHATRKDRASDHVRRNALEDEGWRIRTFTYEQVIFEPRYVADAVRRALAAAV